MPITVWIDQPSEREIDRPHFHLYGWFTSSVAREDVQLTLNGSIVPVSIYRRADIEAAYPELWARGFSGFVWLSDFATSGTLTLAAYVGGRQALRKEYPIRPQALQESVLQTQFKAAKRVWLNKHLKCTVCGTPLVVDGDKEIVCRRCLTAFPTVAGCPNLIPPESRAVREIEFGGNVCSHGYDNDVLKIVQEVKARGGMVLDCGAGYRSAVDENIVTTEVTPFPSTDLLAINQILPFQDNTFDAVLSLHVLEHVSNPFACAQELVRVTKPGGVVFAVTPMIVPEHGYPHHFFNPTIEGLKSLFSGIAQVETTYVPVLGHPMNGLRSILDLYLWSLPEALKGRFKTMTVEELLAGTLEESIRTDIAVRVSEEGVRRLAANYAIRVRKNA